MAEGGPITFGQYQLIEKIAQGGMAEIFRGQALDAKGFERPVVIKRILPHIASSPEFVQMLIEEAKIAVMLSHGNIAQVYDLGKVGDDYFIVMEYVEGRTISQIVKRLKSLGKSFPVPYVLYLCAEIAQGLDYIHRKTDENGQPLGIVHRDISPQNAILSISGTVKIIDFGIAKAEGKVTSTDSGVLKGKFAYMSPEHAGGEKLDQRTDVFSLGVILFELLTGERLFKGKTNIDTLRRVRRAKVPLPSSLRAEIPTGVDSVVLKALQKDRDKRYPSAVLMAQDLTRLIIQNYPEFHPRELAAFLKDCFPELLPQESATPKEPSEGNEKAGDKVEARIIKEEENTQQAKSEAIQQKLTEAEVFDVPEKTIPLPPEIALEKHFQKEKAEAEDKESIVQNLPASRLFFWRRFGTALGILAVVGLLFFIFFRFLNFSSFEKKPIPDVAEKPLVKNDPPPIERSIKPPKGALLISSDPPGADIFIDDQDVHVKTPHHFNDLDAQKSWKIGLYLDPYQYWEKETKLNAEQTNSMMAHLEMNYGDLEINSLPQGAVLIVNGKNMGQTPYRLSKILPGSTFSVTIQKDGYESFSRSVKIFAGKKEVVNATLKKIIEE